MKKLIFGVAILLLAMIPATVRAATPRIALLDSSVNTANFFDRHYFHCNDDALHPGNLHLGREEYKRYFLGWKYVLDGEQTNDDFGLAGLRNMPAPFTHYDYQIIPDTGLTDGSLDSFDILILSNDVSLDDAQDKAVQQWVLKGGKLIATFGSGYKDIINTDPSLTDTMKLQSGGTGGIHQLWHDPLTKAFGTQSITPEDPNFPGIDVLISKTFGPTDIAGWTAGVTKLSYGAEANLLTQRPENFRDALGFLTFNPADSWTRSQPAILDVKASKGHVVYFAFAPEFIVSLAFDLAGHCDYDGNYPGFGTPAVGPQAADFANGFVGGFAGSTQLDADRVGMLMQLMKQTIDYLASIP